MSVNFLICKYVNAEVFTIMSLLYIATALCRLVVRSRWDDMSQKQLLLHILNRKDDVV